MGSTTTRARVLLASQGPTARTVSTKYSYPWFVILKLKTGTPRCTFHIVSILGCSSVK